jgi:hypothetical protein
MPLCGNEQIGGAGMKIKKNVALILLILAVNLAGCGFGGFENPPNTAVTDSGNSPTRVFGVAANGFAANGGIANCVLEFCPINSAGSAGASIKTAHTYAFGMYSTNMILSGPMIVRATGSYIDKYTGIETNMSALRAGVDTINNPSHISVTPFTELALMKAGTFTSNKITVANNLISSLFKVDIVITQPLDLSSKFTNATTGVAEKDYTLALAAFSQMAHDYYNSSVSDALTALNNDIGSGSSLSPKMATQFKTSLVNFLKSDKNLTGILDVNMTNLANAGGSIKTVKISTTGTLEPGQSIGGFSIILQLPAQVTVAADCYHPDTLNLNNELPDYFNPGTLTCPPLSSAITASGVAQSVAFSTNYVPGSSATPASVIIDAAAQSQGFGLGEFLTIYLNIPAGGIPEGTDFIMKLFHAVDTDGAVLPNVALKITY